MNAKTRVIFIDDEVNMEPVYRLVFEKEIKDKVIDFQFFDDPKKSLIYILGLENDKAKTIVITDYKMPEMNGVEMLQTIKEKLPHVQVHLISGYMEKGDFEETLEMGATSYIRKPFDIDSFRKAILN